MGTVVSSGQHDEAPGLSIKAPKAEAAKPRHIEITAGQESDTSSTEGSQETGTSSAEG